MSETTRDAGRQAERGNDTELYLFLNRRRVSVARSDQREAAMVRKWIKAAVILSIVFGASVAHAANYGVTLSYVVPVQCSITYGAASAGIPVGDAIGLGALHEYCNAARGYQLVVHYAPGSLRGMVLIAGDQRVTLDGSGQTVVDVSSIPQIRDRSIAAIPGPQGFDTDHLDFEAIAD